MREGVLLFVLFMFFTVLINPLAAQGNRDVAQGNTDVAQSNTDAVQPKPQAAEIELTGMVRLVGNEPFTEYCITDDTGNDWYVDAESRPLFQGLEHKSVRVKGILENKPQILADGTRLRDKKILHNIEIIKK
ncbi:MAG: hypothetical protein LBM77_07350 [Spirochaetaceae bacterium]|jgi:hypothetical protein|nr:hypothetical protein [Spirochaetaceae bacterium]